MTEAYAMKYVEYRRVLITFPDGSKFTVRGDDDREIGVYCGRPKALMYDEKPYFNQAEMVINRLYGYAEPPTEEDKALWNECVRLLEEA